MLFVVGRRHGLCRGVECPDRTSMEVGMATGGRAPAHARLDVSVATYMKPWIILVLVLTGCAHPGYEFPTHVVSVDLFELQHWYRFDFGRGPMPDGTIPTEVYQVKAKRSDGWMDVVGLDGGEWKINTATIVGFRPVLIIPVRPERNLH